MVAVKFAKTFWNFIHIIILIQIIFLNRVFLKILLKKKHKTKICLWWGNDA